MCGMAGAGYGEAVGVGGQTSFGGINRLTALSGPAGLSDVGAVASSGLEAQPLASCCAIWAISCDHGSL